MQAAVEGEEMEVEDLVCGGRVSRGRGDGCGSRGGVNKSFTILSYYILYTFIYQKKVSVRLD